MPCLRKTEPGLLPEPNVVDVREESIVDETSNLLEMGDYCLGEALIVADLVEEVVTADDDDCSPYISRGASEPSHERSRFQTYQQGLDGKFHRIAGTRAYTNSLVLPCR